MKAVVFHNIVSDPMDEYDRQLYRRHVNGFARTIQIFATRFRLVSLAELLAARGQPEGELEKLAITFDDGFAGNYNLAFPILQEMGVPATLFLPTQGTALDEASLLHFEVLEIAFRLSDATQLDATQLGLGLVELTTPVERARVMTRLKTPMKLLPAPAAKAAQQLLLDQLGVSPERIQAYAHGNPRYTKVSADQVRSLQAAGWTIGGHSRRHFPLSSLDAETLREEVEGNLEELRAIFGLEAPPFAYPYGTAALIGLLAPEAVRAAGYSCAFTTERREIDDGSDLFRLGRFPEEDLLYKGTVEHWASRG